MSPRGFQPGNKLGRPPPKKSDYEPVDAALVPAGIKWKPYPPQRWGKRAFLSMFGNEYMLIRTLETGEVAYFKRKGESPAATPAAGVDAEPERPKQQRFRVGAFCWYVDSAGRWYCCEVVARMGRDRATFGEPARIVLRSTTGWDAERLTAWPFDGDVEISTRSVAFSRVHKLKDRNP